MENTVQNNKLEYPDILDKYVKRLSTSGNYYLFYIKKCCGWGYLTAVPKRMNLEDLYRHISCEMNSEHIKLYATDNNKNMNSVHLIPNRTLSTLNYLIQENKLKPYFTMPAPVVYCLMVDDTHHQHSSNNTNQ